MPPAEADHGLVLRLRDGRALGYAEDGDPHGSPVFNFHGWPGSRLQGGRYAAAAGAAGVRLISPDRPGYGLSDARPCRRIGDWPADVAQLADALGPESFGVLGVSGGGPYALACAALLPERVRGVAVASSVAPFDAPGVAAGANWRERAAFLLFTRVSPLPRLATALLARAARRDAVGVLRRSWASLPPSDRAIVSQPEYEPLAAADLRAALRDGGRAAAREALLFARPWGLDLGTIRSPVNHWQGEADPIIRPAMGRYLAAAVPDCRARFLPGEGHYLAVARAAELFAAIAPDGAP